MAELASESFKRQSELDESVWRSLPFFAASFAFIATVIGRSAMDAPAWTPSLYSFVGNGLLALATLGLAWALRWFWVVLRPRAYEYPAPDAAIRDYAAELTRFHATVAPEGAEIAGVVDKDVVRDLQLFMASQYGAGAAANLEHNAVKLKARSKVLLFMLLSFVLAFACEAIIFVHDRLYGTSITQKGATSVAISGDKAQIAPTREVRAGGSGPPEGSVGDGRGRFSGIQLQGRDRAQGMKKPTSGVSGKPLTADRPKPPAMQAVVKLDQRGIGRETASPSKDPRKKID